MIVLLRKEHPSPELNAIAPQPTCRILSLPAELRVAIWELLLVQKDCSRRISDNGDRFCANVLRTCKQAWNEGTPILYGENTFLAHPSLLSALPSFLLIRRPTRVSLPPVKHPRMLPYIRRYHIHVRLDIDARFSNGQATESFTGIDVLELEVFQAMYGSCDFTNLKLFEGVRGVGKVIVQGSVGDGRYAKWLEHCMMSPVDTEFAAYNEAYVAGVPGWDAWVSGERINGGAPKEGLPQGLDQPL
ncbi:hypothetical protein CLAFUW4_03533 [Fulvia fulva]|uniref:Uncharacterized protein n=1 Tax=Passalora fulva TaxID=5499 RepID=A0A9Q8P5S1_PASFU|nr:uncharacterized protein CLAFUR5_03513 [Fulvia fulva]KAK4632285.1 hypothetical protein CLAFUR4_03522 [Fulvia fulva]KAK4633671.1 hypothetical protein CLAFUR0_03527 [Fulvia fulva]UJO14206.1 hypothetical protein CLAFUR5_03513 [Fulvia fulva]WPV10891.1 hypothetical protein CLAFUW4_03533 [Fulvia fulva]WPV26184.1 hypothetical protein CLAFUW7_03525 [Fulvia fulva]